MKKKINKKSSLIEKKVFETIKKHNLISEKETILVAVSGGKDSISLLNMLSKKFKTEALFIDLELGEFSKINLKNTQDICKKLGIKLNIINFRKEFGKSLCYIRSILKSKGIKLHSCAICGILKRYLFNKKAKELGFKKIATGHNLDDNLQSIFMNLSRGSITLNSRVSPIIGIKNDKNFVIKIKPLFFIEEKEILDYAKENKFDLWYEKCPCSFGAHRRKMDDIIQNLSKKQKLNIINWVLDNKEKLLENNNLAGEINSCRYCEEPSKKDICRACEILSKLR